MVESRLSLITSYSERVFGPPGDTDGPRVGPIRVHPLRDYRPDWTDGPIKKSNQYHVVSCHGLSRCKLREIKPDFLIAEARDLIVSGEWAADIATRSREVPMGTYT